MSKPTIHPLIKCARIFARCCPGLHVPADGSTLVRVQPLTGELLRYAEEVAVIKEGYYNAMKMVLRECSRDVRYVVGFAGTDYVTEHAWVKIDGTHYDPTWQLFSSIDEDYLPLFELDLSELLQEMHERDSLYPPDLRDLRRWADRSRRTSAKNAGDRRSGASRQRLVKPEKGETL